MELKCRVRRKIKNQKNGIYTEGRKSLNGVKQDFVPFFFKAPSILVSIKNYIFLYFIIQRMKTRMTPCLHRPPAGVMP